MTGISNVCGSGEPQTGLAGEDVTTKYFYEYVGVQRPLNVGGNICER